MKTEKGWNLDSSYTQLPEIFFTKIKPIPVPSPKMVAFNYSLAEFLGVDDQDSQVYSGNMILKDSLPIAQAYAGHQFGYFTMLGDGRAILLGEQINPSGERFDIQLKGSGRTPYSRGGDGRATLGPMLREYIISEGMHALGIPTTRSLAVVTTGESVMRITYEPGAILTRTAKSHLRIGTFQYASKWGSDDDLRVLADYALQRHFKKADYERNPYLFLLKEVIKSQAELIAKWQLVGFVHGVMNTDNMTISGETIDYGPCAFMDKYDPETVFSSIDSNGRYAYGNQPNIAAWNLARFAETLLPLLNGNQETAIKMAQDAVSEFFIIFRSHWLEGMKGKLGIFGKEAEDEALINNLLTAMNKYNGDYTNTFLALTFNTHDNTPLFCSDEFIRWHREWQDRLNRQKESKDSSYQLMKNSNPALIPRNHRVEKAIEAAVKQGDYTVMTKFLDVLKKPYAHTPEQALYSELPDPSAGPYRTFCGT